MSSRHMFSAMDRGVCGKVIAIPFLAQRRENMKHKKTSKRQNNKEMNTCQCILSCEVLRVLCKEVLG